MDEKLLQKSEWQVISNTCCPPVLWFVLLKSFPAHALSHHFQGLLVGSFIPEKQLGFQRCDYIVFAT